jgi:hypothetical protein
VVYINTETFNPAKTAEMVLELDAINAKFVESETEYILVVAGRLGSSDPWLGIPVVWAQISHAAVIIETSLPGFQVEPSQGTHFFQNITSLGTIYLTVNPVHKDGMLDFKRLDAFQHIDETHHFKHVRSEIPLIVKADGRSRLGVVTTKS